MTDSTRDSTRDVSHHFLGLAFTGPSPGKASALLLWDSTIRVKTQISKDLKPLPPSK